MKPIAGTLAALTAAGLLLAQAPGRDPAQSPASRPRPKSATKQTYPADQIRRGEQRFSSECGFCHGRDAAGGETGPDLTRSELVAEDNRGDKLGPFLRTGRPSEGMPAFNLSNADRDAIVAFVHEQKTKFDAFGGNRRQVDPPDLATGNAEQGKRYFAGAGGCATCHSAEGDLKGIGSRYQGLALMQRFLYPSGRPAPARPKATITTAAGETIVAPLAVEDEFVVTITDPAGQRRTFQKKDVKYTIDDPLSAHFTALGKYTDRDMHNIYAYLESLK